MAAKKRLAGIYAAALIGAVAMAATVPADAQQKGPPAKPAAPPAKPPAPPAKPPVAPPAKPPAPPAKPPVAPPAKPPVAPPVAPPAKPPVAPPAKPPVAPPKKDDKATPPKKDDKATPPKKDDKNPKKDDKAEEKVKEDAVNAFKEGKKLFEANKFSEALEQFKKADALFPGPAPRFYMGETYEKLGKSAEAIAAYRAFIELKPTGKYGDKLPEAQARVDKLEALVPATLSLKVSPPGVQDMKVTLDNAPYAGTELSMMAGQHTVVVTAQGYQPKTEVVTVKGAEKRELLVTLQPVAVAITPPPPPLKKLPPPEEEGAKHSNVPAYVTLGIAGAGAVLGTVFGVLALGAKSKFKDEPTEDHAQTAERDALIADMSFGVALTFGITGAVLLFSGGDDGAEDKKAASLKPHLEPLAGPHGGGMTATWRF